jgi:hypothetical protein
MQNDGIDVKANLLLTEGIIIELFENFKIKFNFNKRKTNGSNIIIEKNFIADLV